jgi:hypothetical protein
VSDLHLDEYRDAIVASAEKVNTATAAVNRELAKTSLDGPRYAVERIPPAVIHAVETAGIDNIEAFARLDDELGRQRTRLAALTQTTHHSRPLRVALSRWRLTLTRVQRWLRGFRRSFDQRHSPVRVR